MRVVRPFSILVASLLFSIPATGQQPPLVVSEANAPRDPQALAIVAKSMTALGGVVQPDSLATGRIELVAGSKRETGTIRIVTRGLDQTAEHIVTPEGQRAVIYARERATEVDGNSAKRLQLELVVTSQSPCFPLVLLAGALNSPDTAFEYLGQETLGGFAVHHIRFWNTFSSEPSLQYLAEFSVKDLWVDVTTGLVRKLSYDRRAAGGAEPRIPVEVFYSDYRNVGGVLYPFLIEKSLNGTPWATILIENVAFNTGLSEADFSVR